MSMATPKDPPTRLRSCPTCDYLGSFDVVTQGYIGRCRRYAPRASAPSGLELGRLNTIWPPVRETDWCGEWEEAQGVTTETPKRRESVE